MSLVSSSTGIVPAPSKATLNLRGRPYSERSLRMWKCHSRANGRVSISSCGSMPAVGVPVTLRIFLARAMLLQTLVAVERMLLALELLLIGKLLAGGEHAVLRFESCSIGPGRLRRRATTRRGNAGDAFSRFGDLHARNKALQIAF